MASTSASPVAALLEDAPDRLAALQELLPRLGADSVLVEAGFFNGDPGEMINEVLGAGSSSSKDEAKYITEYLVTAEEEEQVRLAVLYLFGES